MIDTKFLQCEALFCNFATYPFYNIIIWVLSKISFLFGGGLETSDSDFRGLLDELVHMVEKKF